MSNFERNNNQANTNLGNSDWESIAVDDFERRRYERARRRYEAMQESEKARISMMNKAKALVAAAVLSITVVAGAAAGGFSTHEIMDTNRAEEVKTISVDSVALMDGPNIRRDPRIPEREEGPNVIMDFGEEGQVAQVPYHGEAYYYHNQFDPNGGWYGFPAEEFARELYEDAFISKKEAEQLVREDSDGVIWFNKDCVKVGEKREM